MEYYSFGADWTKDHKTVNFIVGLKEMGAAYAAEKVFSFHTVK